MEPERDDLAARVSELEQEVARRGVVIQDLSRPDHPARRRAYSPRARRVHDLVDVVLDSAVRARNALNRRMPKRRTRQQAATDDRWEARLAQIAVALSPDTAGRAGLDALLHIARTSAHPGVVWLGLVATLGRYPTPGEVEAAERALDRSVETFGEVLTAFHHAVQHRVHHLAELRVLTGKVVIDVTHTARYDLHTGIQRVVRESVSRWLADDRAVAVWWDDSIQALRELGPHETDRLRRWKDHLATETGTRTEVREFTGSPAHVVVPLNSVFILPEVSGDAVRTTFYRMLASSGCVSRTAAIGYDLVPVMASETVSDGMLGVFNTHLSFVKHCTHLSAISRSAANEFEAFNSALAAQGMIGPAVVAHSLPPTRFHVDESDAAIIAGNLGLGSAPIVLMVGSREPRKNQLRAVVAAAELWESGAEFQLVMVGGSGWKDEELNREIELQRALGRSILVRHRATESELFVLYRMARFSLFPSIYEGFGLPIVESLAAGTPVITSDFGSMAEIASPGGCLLVNPRRTQAIRDAIARLLTDDQLLDQLRAEAVERVFPTWSSYAADVWLHLVGDALTPAAPANTP